MASNHATLDAAAIERKARLAKLASLKRKQPEPDTPAISTEFEPSASNEDDQTAPQITQTYLSGRNYDPEVRGPKLGFENAPNAGELTLEDKADEIAQRAREQAAKEEEEAEKGGIDLFKLQPKKPNWDLKRDLNKKLEILDVRTQNAIARLVRERIQNAKKEAKARISATGQAAADVEGEEVGLDGNTLVEGVHQREQEEQEDERKDRELEDEAPI